MESSGDTSDSIQWNIRSSDKKIMLASTLSRYKLKAHLTHLRGVYVLLALLFCSPFISCEETDSPGDYDIHKVLLPDNIFSEDSEYLAVIGDI